MIVPIHVRVNVFRLQCIVRVVYCNFSNPKMPSEKDNINPGSEIQVSNGDSVLIHSDEDIAAAYANKFDGEHAYTIQEERRLRWKLDLRLVPALWFNITLSAMDKITTSTAALYGMKDATGLTGDRYSWVGSAFYVSENIHNFRTSIDLYLVWLLDMVLSSW